MESVPDFLRPNRTRFSADPFGYGLSAWHLWGLIREASGFSVDLDAGPVADELKSPILWLTHAHAMSEAAHTVLRAEPGFESLPDLMKAICDSQYCAIGLMLVGYSLETCLKALLILRKGVARYSDEEQAHRHHRLEKLAEFVPGLSAKDRAILRSLTHFTSWAGRYPDPGAGRVEKVEEVFSTSERFQISGHDLFELASRVMRHSKAVIEEVS